MRQTPITRVKDAQVINGLVTFQEQDALFPYKRIIGEFRIMHNSEYENFLIGDLVTLCGETGRISFACPTPVACSGMFRFAVLAPVARQPWGTDKTIDVTRPEATYGESADVVDTNQLTSIPAVFQNGAPNLRLVGGNVNIPIGRKLIYVDRTNAEQVRSNWHVHDGADRYRITSVVDLDKPDRLPALVCERSKAPHD